MHPTWMHSCSKNIFILDKLSINFICQFFLASLCLSFCLYFIDIYYSVHPCTMYWLRLLTIMCIKSVEIEVKCFSTHDYLSKRSLRINKCVKIWSFNKKYSVKWKENILKAENVKKATALRTLRQALSAGQYLLILHTQLHSAILAKS